MIKKLNLICVLAIALSVIHINAANMPAATSTSSGWGQQVKYGAAVVGVVAIIGLLVAAYAKIKSKQGGHRLGGVPKPGVMSNIENQLQALTQQVGAERQERENLRAEVAQLSTLVTKVSSEQNQRLDTALAAQNRMLQQKIDGLLVLIGNADKNTLDHMKQEIDHMKLRADDQDKAINLCALKTVVTQSLVDVDARVAKIDEREESTEARLVALEALQAVNVPRKEFDALRTKTKENEEAIAEVRGRVTKLGQQCANHSLKLDKVSQQQIREGHEDQSEERRVVFDVPMSPTAAESHG